MSNELYTTLEQQALLLLRQLKEKPLLRLAEQAKILESVAKILKQIQEQKIEHHINCSDAQIIANIIRRYEPQATDLRVVQIFKEEFELWKSR